MRLYIFIFLAALSIAAGLVGMKLLTTSSIDELAAKADKSRKKAIKALRNNVDSETLKNWINEFSAEYEGINPK